MVLALVFTVITVVPFGQPAADFDTMTLDQQQSFIDVIRPPIVVPVQFSTGRVVVMPPSPLPPAQVDSLIRTYFQEADWAWALRVSFCESNWDETATNRTSGAAGLFQHIPRYWADRSARAGWDGADIYDPSANVAVAAWLLGSGGKSHWVCK